VTLGIDMARSFKALKIWMCLKTYGVETYGRLIEQNIDQAHDLADAIARNPRLELLTPVVLNVVCFRYRHGAGDDDGSLNELNEEIVVRLQESGVAVPSLTQIGNRTAIRVAITNHRSRKDDFEILIDHVVNVGASVAAARSECAVYGKWSFRPSCVARKPSAS
jgi:glutamate/tyrosine decarboxylase-like PLP-dependent enzyme